MKKSDKAQLALEISHIFESGANELRVAEMVEKFIAARFSYANQVEELNRLKMGGHWLIQSAIDVLSQKAAFHKEGKHWFVFKEGRNICEFCGELYHISERNGYCN